MRSRREEACVCMCVSGYTLQHPTAGVAIPTISAPSPRFISQRMAKGSSLGGGGQGEKSHSRAWPFFQRRAVCSSQDAPRSLVTLVILP